MFKMFPFVVNTIKLTFLELFSSIVILPLSYIYRKGSLFYSFEVENYLNYGNKSNFY